MTPEQRRRARDLFEAALEHEPADVLSWLEAAAPDDSVVRAEVRSLLDHHSRAGSFLDPAGRRSRSASARRRPHARAGHGARRLHRRPRDRARRHGPRVPASDARLGRTVALKALAPQLTREPRHRERLRREARAAAVLTHPGICTVYALEELDGELYIATEFVEGHTLRDEIARGRPPLASTQSSPRPGISASAIASAHAKGITHRDLKPENVMRTADGRIKVLDFGLARVEPGPGGIAATLTAPLPGGIVGTPAYMSPEQIEGRAAGPAADVFAFGVLMYEWISGRHPFPGRFAAGDAGARARQHARSAVEPRPGAKMAVRRHRALPAKTGERALRFGVGAAAGLRSSGVVEEAPSRRSSTWWRTHQLVAIVLYVIASAHAWQIKEWLREPISLWVFVVIGIAGSVGGIIRGHLVFTDVMNRPHLATSSRAPAGSGCSPTCSWPCC